MGESKEGTYKVIIPKKVWKYIKTKLKDYKNVIIEIFSELEKDVYPRKYDIKKVKREENTFRIRKGKIRVMFLLDISQSILPSS